MSATPTAASVSRASQLPALGRARRSFSFAQDLNDDGANGIIMELGRAGEAAASMMGMGSRSASTRIFINVANAAILSNISKDKV